jgi:SAM-dependent methyltransferase
VNDTERHTPSRGIREHWESIHQSKAPSELSWYRPHLERSLRFIEAAGLAKNAAIVDVGGGSSTLVDDLVAKGYENVTVLDLSAHAIARARERLGPRAASVTWLLGDVTAMELPEHHFDFWHDRAVFHFLTDAGARDRYVAAVRHAVKPNGHVLVATFGPEGPERCSGLPVMRYSAEGIHDQFGDEFRKVGSDAEIHQTPWGDEQEFVYCYCRMSA